MLAQVFKKSLRLCFCTGFYNLSVTDFREFLGCGVTIVELIPVKEGVQ